jgi:hypothetical protein
VPGLQLSDLRLLVLAPSEDAGAGNVQRGRIFETFVARLLEVYGYDRPTSSHLNYTSDGIELDVVVRHRLTRHRAIAECKAYSRPVRAAELTSFYGKLTVERFAEPGTLGLMVVVPRLTPEGEEQARTISASDEHFMYLNAEMVGYRLRQEGLITDLPVSMGPTSDPAVVVAADGICAAALLLDPTSRVPMSAAVWSAEGAVPDATLDLLSSHEYAQGLGVVDASETASGSVQARPAELVTPPVLVAVQGSKEDFEYQLPASPRYFVGRKSSVNELRRLLSSGPGSVVLNAQSGWGKSSLALKAAEVANSLNGYATVLDSRTANDARFVTEAVRRVATEASADGLLRLPAEPSWASLASCLRTLNACDWARGDGPLLLFFDQFENVFRSEALTRAFRDLAAGVRELRNPVTIGFAWKTDLVGWIEGHPYVLRDEIRSNSTVLVIEPFGSNEVTTLLGRLERELGEKLAPDLRSRLREYSQGLPWLLKKLSDHVLKEVKGGVTQERLLAEALNVESLFRADLAELSMPEQEAIRHVARYAPLPASEVTDRYAPEVVQSLVDRRLIVQIGERLDTYWDTFRDYLNTGRVPVEDSYILRQTPNAVARMLPLVMQGGGSVPVRELSAVLQTSVNVIFNLSRELRLLGVTSYDPNRVTIVSDVLGATPQEQALRRRVARSLRRHRAFSSFTAVSERGGGSATPSAFANDLPRAFPAVEVRDTTWSAYARVFLAWFAYAGLAREVAGRWSPRPDGDAPSNLRLLAERPVIRTRPGLPQEAPRRALGILGRLGRGETVGLPENGSPDRDAARTLLALGAVEVTPDREIRLARSDLLSPDGLLRPVVLFELLNSVPGGAVGIDVLRRSPSAAPAAVGEAMREAVGASWTPASTHSIGGYFRAWAKLAGVEVTSVPRRPATGRRRAGTANGQATETVPHP